MTEFEMATIAARITGSLIAARAEMVAATIPRGTTNLNRLWTRP